MILLSVISTTIEKAEVIDFYKTLLVNQSSNYSTLISFFMGITILVIGSTWFWNFVTAKKQIKSEVDKRVKLIEENLDLRIEILFKKEVSKIELELTLALNNIFAHTRMLYALQCSNVEDAETGINWWAGAIDKFIEVKSEENIRLCVKNILVLLSRDIKNHIKKETFDFDGTIEIIKKISPLLSDEKIEIINKINCLRSI